MTMNFYAPQAQNEFPLPRIKCGHCGEVHSSVGAVKNCSRNLPVMPGVVAQVTTAPQAAPEPEPRKRPETGLSAQDRMVLGLLMKVQDGYYCSQPTDDASARFFRISRPKKGRDAGAFKIQSKHSDDLRPVLVVWNYEDPEKMRPYWFNANLKEEAILMAVDPIGCALRYSAKLNQCARCTKDLTDGRSRWLGIGPECEKVWTEFVETVVGMKGPYIPEHL